MKILVTFGGECFEAAYIDVGNADGRDGVLYYFKLQDLLKDRGLRNVSMFRSGTDRVFIENYDAQVETVRLNVLRRAFDSGAFSFETPVVPDRYHELRLRAADFQPQKKASDESIRRFLKLDGYWLGFKFRPNLPGTFHLDFGDPIDLDYLGTTIDAVARNLSLLTEQGYFHSSTGAVSGKPTKLLIEEHEGVVAGTTSQRAGGTNLTQNIHMHGPNARINVNSTDNSTNIASVSSDQLFVQLRETASAIADESERAQIIARLDDLEHTRGSGGFLQAYQSFIASVADYMTIFGPFGRPSRRCFHAVDPVALALSGIFFGQASHVRGPERWPASDRRVTLLGPEG